MRTIDESNPLIVQHRNSKGECPMPNDFDSFETYLVAHRNWLRELRLQNNKDLRKVFHLVRSMRGNISNGDVTSLLFAYLSKVIHMRKEYDAFLVRGIDATTRHIEGK